MGQAGDFVGAWDSEAIAEEAPEGEVELGAGLSQAEHDVTGDLPRLADGMESSNPLKRLQFKRLERVWRRNRVHFRITRSNTASNY